MFPKLIESRKRVQEEAIQQPNDKGFYNEGMTMTKEPPKKVNFNAESNVNPFASGINLDEVKNNATFSKHIFEDKTIIDILEKKAGNKSKAYNDDDFDFALKNTDRKKDIFTEKKGKVVIEKGESHADPYARLGHIIFKLFSVISYLVLSSSSSNANIIYQAVIIFSAVDFWLVKNVTARYIF